MILLKEGLGGHGKQPYDDETGKWVNVDVEVGGVSVSDIDGFVKAVLTANDMVAQYEELDQESKDAFVDEQLRPAYESLLQSRIDAMNRKNSVYGGVYKTQAEIQEALPKLFSPDYFEEYLKMPAHGNSNYLSQKSGYPRVPICAHTLMKLRYGDVKFDPITEEEYQRLRQFAWCGDDHGYGYSDIRKYNFEPVMHREIDSGRNIVLFRGMHYDYDENPEQFSNVFRGYVDSEETGTNMCLSLLGGGCLDTVIYMSTQHGYSRQYANYGDHGMLIHAIFESKGANVLYTHDGSLQKARMAVDRAWANVKDQVLADAHNKFPNRTSEIDAAYYTVDKLIRSGDCGFIALVMGYDAVSGEAGNGNQLDILNPRRVKISEQFER